MIIVSFDGNPQTTVISCYSPTNVSLGSDVEEFYEAIPLL